MPETANCESGTAALDFSQLVSCVIDLWPEMVEPDRRLVVLASIRMAEHLKAEGR